MESIAAFQIAILISTIVARLFSPKAMMNVALAWTAWTLLMVFAGPLFLLQLVTIWLPVMVMAPGGSPKIASVSANPKTVVPPQEPAFLTSLNETLVQVTEGAKAAKARLEFERPFHTQANAFRAMLGASERLVNTIKLLERNLSCGTDQPDANYFRIQLGTALPEAERTDLPDLPATIVLPPEGPLRLAALACLEKHLETLIEAERRLNDDPDIKAALIRYCTPDPLGWLTTQIKRTDDLLGKPTPKVPVKREPPLIDRGLPANQASGPVETTSRSDVPSSAGPFATVLVREWPPATRPPLVFLPDSVPTLPPVSVRHAAAIRGIAQARAIPHLVHFTRAANLPGVLQHGLLSRRQAAKQGVVVPFNDALRLDGRSDRISLSVAFPNCKMFYKYRTLDPKVDWVVLLLSPDILWAEDCLFCAHNAADARMIGRSATVLAATEAFEAFFSTEGRADVLKSCDPTDVQAEVMVASRIAPRWIEAVAFETNDALRANRWSLGGAEAFACGKDSGLFAPRQLMRANTR